MLRMRLGGPLALIRLDEVMTFGEGEPGIAIGLLDGPVADHPDLIGPAVDIRPSACKIRGSAACVHGTLVAGVLAARRGTFAPGICPACRLLVRPIFSENGTARTAAGELADGIVECVDAGARIVNVSAAFTGTVSAGIQRLHRALDHAARRGVIVVAAAGNEARVGGSPLTSHPWVVPVSSCDSSGRPLAGSNLGGSIGRHGLRAPGEGIVSLSATGGYAPLHGTSAAAALVTGAIALAWSAALTAPPARIRLAVAGGAGSRRGPVPPLLDAMSLYESIIGSA